MSTYRTTNLFKFNNCSIFKISIKKNSKDFKSFRQKIKTINDVKKIKINNLKLQNIHFRYNKKEYLIKNFNFNFKKIIFI